MSRSFQRREFLAMCAATLSAPGLAAAASPRDGYLPERFKHGGIELKVWRKGTGPLVFVLHDMLGLRDHYFHLCNQLVKKQFSVALPEFFGASNRVTGYLKSCGSSKFRCHNGRDPGDIGPWIKALAVEASGTANFGAVGNCMTGALPLLMLQSPRCVAPVLCQPSFPFVPGDKDQLGLAEEDLVFAATVTRRDAIPVFGLRFKADTLCPPQRFDTLQGRFGDLFHPFVMCGKEHSTFITHEHGRVFGHAFRDVVGFLQHRLAGATWTFPASEDCPAS
jgi:dienelactone hydrolase